MRGFPCTGKFFPFSYFSVLPIRPSHTFLIPLFGGGNSLNLYFSRTAVFLSIQGLGDLTLAPQSLISFKTALSLQLGLYIMTGR